ncbi:hypothetical protein [Rhizobium laguerreae]|uniref:hypothetical protein n=1 Tax=Rhizobium laguerreae TaxID=1076926 RepID=UPI0028ABBD1A|nr:hypothetical protein [Rhizobium laguerreae]
MHTRGLLTRGVKVDKLALTQARQEGAGLFNKSAALAWARGHACCGTQVPDSTHKAVREVDESSSIPRSRSAS